MSRARDTADQINRVNSSAADATAITVDSSENVGIGNSSSGYIFTTGETRLSVGDGTEHAGIQVLSGTNKWGGLEFADDTTNANAQGLIAYYHPDNYMHFKTNGSERLRILSGGGITFNGDTAAANALDDYEEGTFALNNAGDSTGVVASTGKYVKIGRQVTVHAIANVTNNFTSQAMDGLPFAPSHVTTFSSIHGAAVCIGANVFAVNCNSGLTRVEFRNTSHAATAPTTGPIRFTMVYQTT